MTSIRRSAFTLIEVLVVLAIVAIIGVVTFFNLNGGKQSTDVSSTAQQMVVLAQEAQSRAASQNQDLVWGIHFANSTNTAPFYALFTGLSYSTATTQSYYRLPATIAYATSTVPSGSSVDVTFSPISGHPSSSATITIVSTQNPSIVENISVNSAGLVSFNNSNQHIWVVDSSNNRVEEFDSYGDYISQFGSYGTSTGQFNDPTGIAVDSSGNLWVADHSNQRIEEFNSNGSYLSQFNMIANACQSPDTVAIGPSGTIEEASMGRTSCYGSIYSTSGTYLNQVNAGFGTVYSGLATNPNVSYPSASTWFLSITGGGVMGIASNEGLAFPATSTEWTCGPQTATTSVPVQHSYLAYPGGGSSLLYIPETANNQIIELGGFGQCWNLTFGSAGSGPGQFNGPTGIAVDASGNMYVVDSNNNRVEKFDPNGNFLLQFGSYGNGNGQLNAPGGGIAIY